jgi:hypothetical protein
MFPDVVAIGTGTLLRSKANVLVGGAVPPIPASPSGKNDGAEEVVE